MQFSKKQVTQMLGISARTLDRHIAAGRLAVERGERKNFEQSVTVSLEALGQYLGISDEQALRSRLGLPCVKESLTEPSSDNLSEPPASAAESAAHPEPVGDLPTRPLTREEMDRIFAARFLAGEVPDSYGNYIDGSGSGNTAIGKNLDKLLGRDPESQRDPRYQPIRFWRPPTATPQLKRVTGYGVTQDDLDRERTALAARRRFSR